MTKHALAAILALTPFGLAQTTAPASEKENCCDDQPAACCAPKDSVPAGPGRVVTALGDSLDLVRAAFNAQADRPRVVALVSPACSECVLGAQAVERSVLERFPGVEGVVVWTPMIEGDSEEAARASSGVFGESVPQFYDAKNLAGWAYQHAHFSKAWDEADAALPPDHWLRKSMEGRAKDSAQWDLYMIYKPGVRWEGEAPPRPDAFIRHLGRTSKGASCYFRDRFTSPPQLGDLFSAMEKMTRETVRDSHAPVTVEVLGRSDCPNTPGMRANVRTALRAAGLTTAEFEYVDQSALKKGDSRGDWPTPTVLVNGRDLFGMTPPSAPSMGCRVYPNGLPDTAKITERLRAIADK